MDVPFDVIEFNGQDVEVLEVVAVLVEVRVPIGVLDDIIETVYLLVINELVVCRDVLVDVLEAAAVYVGTTVPAPMLQKPNSNNNLSIIFTLIVFLSSILTNANTSRTIC